jgi:hypothetical protein
MASEGSVVGVGHVVDLDGREVGDFSEGQRSGTGEPDLVGESAARRRSEFGDAVAQVAVVGIEAHVGGVKDAPLGRLGIEFHEEVAGVEVGIGWIEWELHTERAH